MGKQRKNSKLGDSDSKSEIDALIRLLDDPDEQVFEHVSKRLKLYGSEIVPALETAWEVYYEPEVQSRIEDLIHGIQFEEILFHFQNYINTEADNLLKGAILVARYRYPDLDETDLLGQIEKIKRAIWLELNYDLTPFEQINVINRVFFGFFGYKAENYSQFEPKAFFLPQVLEAKRGSPLLISILYMIVVQELDIPVYGVDIPLNFSVAYCAASDNYLEDSLEQVQFYINPLNAGQIFSEKEINDYLQRIALKAEPSYFQPMGNKYCIKQLLVQLKKSFEADKSYPRVEEIRILLEMFD